MSVRATVRSFALPLGVMSGLFAMVQVFVSVYAARASGPALRSLHEIFGGVSLGSYLDGSAPGISSNPLPLLGDVLGTMFVTYTAAFVTGCITLGFCWYAGRQVAFVLGRHTAGGRTGFQVMLISSLIWVAVSVIAILVVGADGTLTGVFTSAFVAGSVGTELVGLLVQQALLILFGFGIGALFGKFGEWSAQTVPQRPSAPMQFMAPYPPYPYPGPGAPMPVPPAAPNWMPYPPPPSYYYPYPGTQQPPQEPGAPLAPESPNKA